MQDAGFVDIDQTTSTYPFNLGDDKETQFKMTTFLFKDKIDRHGDEGIRDSRFQFFRFRFRFRDCLVLKPGSDSGSETVQV